eukprot:361871-Chlamydomonas_euryale.AAC.10
MLCSCICGEGAHRQLWDWGACKWQHTTRASEAAHACWVCVHSMHAWHSRAPVWNHRKHTSVESRGCPCESQHESSEPSPCPQAACCKRPCTLLRYLAPSWRCVALRTMLSQSSRSLTSRGCAPSGRGLAAAAAVRAPGRQLRVFAGRRLRQPRYLTRASPGTEEETAPADAPQVRCQLARRARTTRRAAAGRQACARPGISSTGLH